MLAQRPSFGYAMKKNNADKQQEQGVVDMETSRPTRLSPSGKPRTSADRLAPEASARPSAATSPEAASATATPDKAPASAKPGKAPAAPSATPDKSPASAAAATPATSPADSSPTANPAASDDIKEKPRRKKISAPTATPVSSGTPPTNAPEASARPSAATSPEAASPTAAAGKSPAPAASATPGTSASADLDDEEEADFAEPEILPADEEDLMSDFGSGLSEGDDLFDSDHVIDLLPPGGEGDLPVPSSSRLPTPSARDNLQLYLREVSRFPLLSPDEEVELARRVRDTGDSDAAFRIISSHLRLVVKIAMDFQRRWMQNVLDLIQEGNVGLMRAVNKFDPDKGIKFSYYATFWIRAYILKFIMDNWRRRSASCSTI